MSGIVGCFLEEVNLWARLQGILRFEGEAGSEGWAGT